MIVAALIFYRTTSGPVVHHGSNIELDFHPLSSMLVESDQPVTLQASGDRSFVFLNTDDGSVIQGAVVSTAVQNVSGEMAFQFGPKVIPQGHWEQVDSSDADSTLQLVLTSDSELGVTTYPDRIGAGAFAALMGVLFWVLGMVLIEAVRKSLKDRTPSQHTVPAPTN